MKPFGWAFIGAGKLVGKVAEQIIPTGRHRIAAVYTRRFEACKSFADRYGACACQSVEEALQNDGVDGVYVVTPHNSHAYYALLALQAQKPVLVEKAFAVNAAQADAVIDLAKQKGVYLAEAMWTFFSPVAQQALQWVHGNALGQIQKAHIHIHRDAMGYAPRVSDPRCAGGALLDLGVYAIYYLYRLFGMPQRIRCRGNLSGGIDLDEEIELLFPGNIKASVSVSIADAAGGEVLEIIGSRGTLHSVDFHMADAVTFTPRAGCPQTFHGDGSLLNELDIVSQEMRSGCRESRFVPLQATRDVMRILDECRAQMGLVYENEHTIIP